MKFGCIILCLVLVSCDAARNTKPLCTSIPLPNQYGDGNQHGYYPFYTLEDAQSCASSTGRRILAMFTGYSTMADVNQPWQILSNEDVKQLIGDEFILVVLYVDDPHPSVSNANSTIGQDNSRIEINMFNSNAQPLYACLDKDLNLLAPTRSYTPVEDAPLFIAMLESSLK